MSTRKISFVDITVSRNEKSTLWSLAPPRYRQTMFAYIIWPFWSFHGKYLKLLKNREVCMHGSWEKYRFSMEGLIQNSGEYSIFGMPSDCKIILIFSWRIFWAWAYHKIAGFFQRLWSDSRVRSQTNYPVVRIYSDMISSETVCRVFNFRAE